jgi:Fe-S oxidoreductase
MSELPTFEQALSGMGEAMQRLPEMAPSTDMPDEERVERALEVFRRNGVAQFATYLDACVHCGHCAEACHFYQAKPEPRYTPIHKLRLFSRMYRRELSPFRWLHRLLEPRITARDLEEWQELVFDSCTMCGRCSMICPMGIDIATMVHVGRGALNAAGLTPPAINAVLAEQQGRDMVFQASADKLRETLGMIEEQEGVQIPLDRERADILVLLSGFDIVMNPRGILATAKVMNHLGVDWTVRSDGFESINFGAQACDDEAHAEIARRRIEVAQKVGASTVLLCECGHTYPALRWAEVLEDKPLPFEVLYVSEFLGRQVQAGRLRLENDGIGSVTFHDPCKLGRVGGVFEEPREVLKAMGAELRETPDNGLVNYCCGGGGAVFLLERAMPLRAGVYRLKIDQFDATGAERVVTACGSCRLNFVMGAQMHHWEKPISSLVELAADHLPGEGQEGEERWRRPGPAHT